MASEETLTGLVLRVKNPGTIGKLAESHRSSLLPPPLVSLSVRRRLVYSTLGSCDSGLRDPIKPFPKRGFGRPKGIDGMKDTY